MQAAATRGKDKTPSPGREAAPVASAEQVSQMEAMLAGARQTYLDALPIAAAIVTSIPNEPLLEAANELFRSIAEWDERLGERRLSQI